MNNQKLFLAILFAFFSTALFAQPDLDKPRLLKDQQILDDLIVDGSACIGQDCVNGESFGFKTLRLKENNLRIHFDDTSTSASFPSADWCIQINDSSNGGGNYYGIVHEDTGRRIFSLEANAPQHALYVDDGGKVGLGTASPVVELHVVDGDSPTLRLEQDGSSGFTPQTWDVAGNEAGFFVRDATNGSTLPFRILPGASSQAFVIAGNDEIGIGAGTNPAAKFHIENTSGQDTDDFVVTSDGKVGIGTTSPDARLHIENTSGQDTDDFVVTSEGKVGIGTVAPLEKFHMVSSTGNGWAILESNSSTNAGFIFRNGTPAQDWSSGSRNGKYQISSAYGLGDPHLTVLTNGNVGIGPENPTFQLQLNSNSAAKPGDADWDVSSDRRLKRDINDFEDGLDKLMSIRPVTFKYNGKGGIKCVDKEFVGVIAQELQEVAPYMVGSSKLEDGPNGIMNEYLTVNPGALTYILVNSIQEQQTYISQQTERIDQIEQDNLDLKELVLNLKNALENPNNNNQVEINLENKESSYINQNTPNPFNGQTEINYKISKDVQSAAIQIVDMTGKLVRLVDISERGKGTIKINTQGLAQGTYSYTLITDSKIVATHKMVLSK